MASNLCTEGWKRTPNFAMKERERQGGSSLRDEDPLLFFAPAFIVPSG